LAQVLGISFIEAAKLAGVTGKVASSYQALMGLKDRETFLSHGVPIERAGNVMSVIATAKHQTRRQINEEMEDEEVVNLEHLLVQKLVSGEFRTAEDMRTLRDSFVKDAKNITKFMKGSTPAQLFKASDAGGVRAYRKLKTMMSNLNVIIAEVTKSKDAALLLEEDKGLQSYIKHNIKGLNSLI
jgi:hypothetical protein